MALEPPKINIGGEMIDMKDIKGLVKASTKKEQEKIKKDEKDIVEISDKYAAYKTFETSCTELINSLKPLTSDKINNKSVFTEKFPMVIGITAADFTKYADVDVDDNAEYGMVTMSITQLAQQQEWQSVVFSSKSVSVVQPSGVHTNTSLFTAGTLYAKIQNNAQVFNHNFTSITSVAVDGTVMNSGTFYINDSAVVLDFNDTVGDVINKINTLNIGITAEFVNNQIKLTTDKFGAEYSYAIIDSNGVFSTYHFTATPDYQPIVLTSGMNLQQVAYAISAYKEQTLLGAAVAMTGRNKYTLMLSSTEPGVDNGFVLYDGNPASGGTKLTGSNSTSVCNSVFNQTNTIVQQPRDANAVINGANIVNTTNVVEMLHDVKITLKAVTTSPITFDIQHDMGKVAEAIGAFVAEYNIFIRFYQMNNTKENGRHDFFRSEGMISDLLTEINAAILVIEDAKIGITFEDAVFDEKIGDKTEKIKYRKIAKIDNTKFAEAMHDDMEKVQDAFDDILKTSSGDFIPPIFKKDIVITKNGNEAHLVGLNATMAFDPTKATIKSNATTGFLSAVTSAVGTDTSYQFSPGTFYINNQAITLTSGMNLNDVISAINSVQTATSVAAVVQTSNGGSYIQLVQYGSGYEAQNMFQNLEIYDPNNILHNVFSNSIASTNITGAAITSGTITINGHQISIVATTGNGNSAGHGNGNNTPTTISNVITTINAATATTGVTATLINGNKQILFTNSTTGNIVITGLNTVVTGANVITPAASQAFWDCSKVATIDIQTDGVSDNKRCQYTVSGATLTSGGKITIVNNSSDALQINGLELLSLGNTATATTVDITLSKGSMKYMLSQIEGLTKKRSLSSGRTIISDMIKRIEDNKESKVETKEKDEESLKKREAMLYEKYAKMNGTFGKYDAYSELMDMMMEMNSKKK